MDTHNNADLPLTSSYYDRPMIAEAVARGEHRQVVGGLWDELGLLQFEYLKAQGLEPGHYLLDIGCGCLRGGVHFARYLNPGHYYGIDANQSLLDAGRQAELAPAGIADRVPPENLRCCDDFDLAAFGRTFDFALAVSLFTHLPAPYLRVCLERLAWVMQPGGKFYASFFLVPAGLPFAEPLAQTPEITTHATRDPYHYKVEDIRSACLGLPWSARIVGDWGHPRNQLLVVFERAAEGLRPGDANYRAYVGPPERYDFMGASQFALLFQLGLREDHRVLDFGCGSLRLGRLLIPWLLPGCYFGIDPNRWLIEEGFAHELGQTIRELKQPTFSYNADFDCTVFGYVFDFVVAQSILTHCGPDLCRRFFGQMARCLAPGGIAVLSYIHAPAAQAATPQDGWHYPQCVPYAEAAMLEMAREAGLAGTALPWHHPGAAWLVVARRQEDLPNAESKRRLNGTTLGRVAADPAVELPPQARRPNPRVLVADQDEAASVSTRINLGRATLVEPANGIVVAGSNARVCLEYTVGAATVATGGRILFCFHHVCTWTAAQTTNPTAAGYVQARASNSAPLKVSAWGDRDWNATTMNELFPWQHAVEVLVGSPGLSQGDRISVTYGAGPLLAEVQSFEAHPYSFRVLVDPQHLGVLLPAEEHPRVEVVGGLAVRLVVLTSSDHEEGKAARVLVRLEDAAGNLADGFEGEIVLEGPLEILANPQSHHFQRGERPVKWFEGVELRTTEHCQLAVRGPSGLRGYSNPFRVWPRGSAFTPVLWGEIHGHSSLSDGYGSPEEYFAYARDVAGLDIAALTEHDFMVSDHDWACVKSACNAANVPGEFVTIQAYEWTGSSEVGGDRNVYFRGDDPLICRSRPFYDYRNIHVYHGPDRGGNHVEDLFRWLDETVGPEGAVVVPHWGGRPANSRWTDPRYEHLVEICSEHQNSEQWAEGFRRSGARFGFVAGGDDHIGRPGNGYLAYGPGTGGSGGTGRGLVAVLACRDREAVYQALAARSVYATTGARILLDCDVAGVLMGESGVCSAAPLLRANVQGTGPLLRLEALRDGEVVHSQVPSSHPHRIQLQWRDQHFPAAGRECAYWFRAVQVDGHLAVSSPVWLTSSDGVCTCQGR